MKQMLTIWLLLLFFALALSSCTKADELTEAVVSPTATPTAPPLAFEIPEIELPLAEPGPYEISHIPGVTTYDEERAERMPYVMDAVETAPQLDSCPESQILL